MKPLSTRSGEQSVHSGNQPLPAQPTDSQGLSAGMSQAELVFYLLQTDRANLPQRRAQFGEAKDPFGLLEQDDRYEAYAKGIFGACEAIYRDSAARDPQVAGQVRESKGDSSSVTLPLVKLEIGRESIYHFQMRRSANTPESVQYDFSRTDEGYKDRGFRVIRTDQGNVVLRNIEQGDTDVMDDTAYYKLLRNAHKWVEYYAVSLGVPLERLTAIDNSELKLYGLTTKLGEIAVGLGHNIKRAGEIIFTRSRDGKRKPRIAGLMLAMSILPTSFHTILPENVYEAGAAVVGIMGSDSKPQPSFDSLGLQLPANSTTLTLGVPEKIAYVPDLDPAIVHGAPETTSQEVKVGAIRQIDPTALSNAALPEQATLGPDDCTAPYSWGMNLSKNGQVKIVNVDPNAAGRLTVTATAVGLTFCNSSPKPLSLATQDYATHRGEIDAVYFEIMHT